MKRPAFQFYPADWRNNAKLRRCSEAARGAWIDILCLMHDADEYGVLRWPLADVVRASGASRKAVKELVEKGVLKGADRSAEDYTWAPTHAGKRGDEVTLVVAGDGPCWYCTRFVRDEYVRQRRGANTRFEAAPKEAPNAPPMGGFGEVKGDGASSASSFCSTDTASHPPPAADWVGAFEGHERPAEGRAMPNPIAPLAIALTSAGFQVTTRNPALVAYHGEGGDVEHLLAIAKHADCVGKNAGYVLGFARRELAEKPKPVAAGAPRAGPNGHAPKSVQGLSNLEELRSEQRMAAGRNRDGYAETRLLVVGTDAGG